MKGKYQLSFPILVVWDDYVSRALTLLDSLYTDVVLFFFSFFSKTLASANSENGRGARERKINNVYFLLPYPYSLALAANKSPAVFNF